MSINNQLYLLQKEEVEEVKEEVKPVFPKDKDFIREKLPYCLDINANSNEIYGINRDYEYINTRGKKCLSDIVELEYSNDFTRYYLYNDQSFPNTYINYKKYIDKINNLCINKKFININDSIQSLLHIV